MNRTEALNLVASYAAPFAANMKPGEYGRQDSCLEYRRLGQAFLKLAETAFYEEQPTFLAASEACHQRADAIEEDLANAVRSFQKPANGS